MKGFFAACLILLLIPTTGTAEQLDIEYDEIAITAVLHCPNARSSQVDVDLIKGLVRIERGYNPPPHLRGMLLAAACAESGYNFQHRGDRKFSKSGKRPMSHGLLQLWPWWEKAYGIDRDSWEQSSHAWMMHIKTRIPRVRKQCRIRRSNKRKLWEKAWVHAVRSRKPHGRCSETVTHLHLLRRWHKKIRKEREKG